MYDVRRLRVLAQVASHGSFSAAGVALGMTQSAVSQQIAALERQVGQPVVRRGTRPVELTESGSALARHAHGILIRLDAAEQEVAEIAGRRRGRFRLGCFPTASATLVPAACARFRRMHPDVALTVVDDQLPRLVRRLGSGELDLALTYDHEALRDGGAGSVERTPLLLDRFHAVLPAAHPLARRPSLQLTDLHHEPWIGGPPSSAWFRIVRHSCQQAGFNPRVVVASEDSVAVQALVAARLGVSVLPGLALANPLPGVVVRPLASGAPARRVEVTRPADGYPSQPLTDMIDSLRRAVRATSLESAELMTSSGQFS